MTWQSSLRLVSKDRGFNKAQRLNKSYGQAMPTRLQEQNLPKPLGQATPTQVAILS
jgi:hypothetical protein